MKLKTALYSTLAVGFALSAAACKPLGPPSYTGPGCLIYVFALPNLRGYALPVTEDTAELSPEWSKSAASAQIVWGTWRLYSQPYYEGSMGDFEAHTDIMRLKPEHQLGSLACIKGEPPPPPPPPKY